LEVRPDRCTPDNQAMRFYSTEGICFVDGGRFEGQGVDTAPDINTYGGAFGYGLQFDRSGTALCMAKNCAFFYNGRHGVGATSASAGGIVLYENCVAGYGSVDSTPFVDYSGPGGFQSYHENMVIKF